MTRQTLLRKICQSIGDGTAQVRNAWEGWPGRVRLQVGNDTRDIAMHVAPVGTHSRAAHEYRFQNPDNQQKPDGKKLPVSNFEGAAFPVLVGHTTCEGKDVLVCASGVSRLGHLKRFPILFSWEAVQQAARYGWSTYISKSGELIIASWPPLFPTVVEALEAGVADIPNEAIAALIGASGMIDEPESDLAADRARQTASKLVRDRRFGKLVKDAFGSTCAMSGLSLKLCVSAHIYPAAAPGSADNVWNGLTLSPLHHDAFDAHLIWVDPTSFAIRFHPDVLEEATRNPAVRGFVDMTFTKLVDPGDGNRRRRASMLDRRYQYFAEYYQWVAP